MQRHIALVFILMACGPIKLPGDSGGPDEGSSGGGGSESSGGGSAGSDGSSGGDSAASTGTGSEASTTGETGGTSTMTMPPTVTGDTDDPPGETSGGPQPGLVQVLTLHAEPGEQSGLEGIALWQSGMPDGCDDPPPVACGELPVLGVPKLLVDGEFAGADAVPLQSSVAALFPFEHPGCALGCAEFTLTVLIGDGGDGVQLLGSLPVDLPCSTTASDVWLAVDFNRVGLPQHYTAQLKLTDRCGAFAESPEVLFVPQG